MANKRRTPQEIVLGLKEQIRKLEAQSREREKAADAAKQRRLVDLVKRAGLYNEPEDVILGILIKAHTSLQDPERGEAVRSEARGIAAFGDPATLDGMIQRALQPVVPTVPSPQPERPQAGTVLAEAPAGSVSTTEAAQITSRSPAKVLSAVHDGRLYAVRVPGPGRAGYSWRFDRRDLEAFLTKTDSRHA